MLRTPSPLLTSVITLGWETSIDRRGADVQITEEVIKAAAGNSESGTEVITLLLDRRGADVQITEEAVRVIAEHFDQAVMTLFLDHYPCQLDL